MASLTYGLADEVDVVGDLEIGQLLLHLRHELLRGEAHGVDIVGPHGEGFGRRLHHLQRGPQAVVDVHHGQPCVWLQVALELAGLHCIVEDLHGVVWAGEHAINELEGYWLPQESKNMNRKEFRRTFRPV